LLIAGFCFLVFKLIAKSKAESWQGEVIDKKEFSKKDDETKRIEHFYHLVVRTNDGKERKVGLSQGMYNRFTIGDKIIKPKDKLFPEKLRG
jgi:hypothetical protein